MPPVPALVLPPIPVLVPEVPVLLFIIPPVPVVVPVLLVVVPVVFPVVPLDMLPLLASRVFPGPEPEQPLAQMVKLVTAISVKSFRIELLRIPDIRVFLQPYRQLGASEFRRESLRCSSLLTFE
jgi:hypothetical protein